MFMPPEPYYNELILSREAIHGIHPHGRSQQGLHHPLLPAGRLSGQGGGEDRARHVPLNNLLTDVHDVFIAYGGGRPVGCAGFKAHSRETAEVKRVFVREDCRGRGIARGPMLALKRLAYERGYSRLILETARELSGTVGLFRSLGCRDIPNCGSCLCTDAPLCMEKRLDKRPLKFLLRPWQEGDIPSVAHYANNPAIAASLRDIFPHPYTLEDAGAYIRGCMERGQRPVMPGARLWAVWGFLWAAACTGEVRNWAIGWERISGAGAS